MIMLLLRGLKWKSAPKRNTKREETMEPENKFGALQLNFAPFLETLKLHLHAVWIRSPQEKVKEKECLPSPL